MPRMIALVSVLLLATPVFAESFKPVTSRDSFVSLMQNRELTRLGISLTVTPDGRIDGRAFGLDVSGAWRWQSGYFCRDLYWGSKNLGPNCQAVKVQGQTVRFISDQGTGEYADLTLR